MGLADASLRPLGIRTQPLVLDSGPTLLACVRLVGERTRVCRLVPARLRQSTGLWVVGLSRKHLGRLDGAAATAVRRAWRVREHRGAGAAADSGGAFCFACGSAVSSAARSARTHRTSSDGGRSRSPQLEQSAINIEFAKRVGVFHVVRHRTKWRSASADRFASTESDAAWPGSRRPVHPEHRSSNPGDAALSIVNGIQHGDAGDDPGLAGNLTRRRAAGAAGTESRLGTVLCRARYSAVGRAADSRAGANQSSSQRLGCGAADLERGGTDVGYSVTDLGCSLTNGREPWIESHTAQRSAASGTFDGGSFVGRRDAVVAGIRCRSIGHIDTSATGRGAGFSSAARDCVRTEPGQFRGTTGGRTNVASLALKSGVGTLRRPRRT